MLVVYSPDKSVLCELDSYESNENFMGDNLVTSTKKSSTSIDFKVGSYLDLGGQRFEIYHPKPTAKKSARTGAGVGDAMSYDLTFYSEQRKLQDIGFYDYVPGYKDTDLYYTGNPQVSFYGTVNELLGRLQANTDRFYEEQGAVSPWVFQLDSSFASQVASGEALLTELNIATSNMSCWEALQMANDQFELDFYVTGTSVTVGGVGTDLPFSLEYGKDKGLRDIQLAYDNSQKLITRLKVLGSNINLPKNYRSGDLGVATNLKLPESWGTDYIDVDWNYDPGDSDTFIWRALKDEYGVIEGSKEPYEIKPSIEGSVSDVGDPLDQVVVGTSNSISDESANFAITVNDPGFNPVDLAVVGDSPRLSIKSQRSDGGVARLGGYEFTIVSASSTGTKLLLVCARNTEEPTALPSSALTLDPGDNFVYLGIQMPESYVLSGENLLLAKGQQDVQRTNGLSIQYSMTPSSIFMSENPDYVELVRAGNNLPIIDNDLGVEGQPIKIQTVSVKYGFEPIPRYDLTIANIKYKTLKELQRVSSRSQSNYNQVVNNDMRSTTNVTNVIGGSTPSWQILE